MDILINQIAMVILRLSSLLCVSNEQRIVFMLGNFLLLLLH